MRKLVTRHDGTKGTAHKAIANGTMQAGAGRVFVVFTSAPGKPWLKGFALNMPTNELKFRGQYVDRLPESVYLSPDR
jgi:hypothetical protein